MQRASQLLATAFILLLLGCHVAWRAEPWDNSLGGVNGGAYYGYACKGLAAHGFFAKRMLGPELFHRDDPAIWRPYANHPGTGYFFLYPAYLHLGRDEASLRWAMLGMLGFSLVMVWLGLRRVARPEVTAATLMLLSSLPLLYQYGNMVDIPLLCLAMAPITLARWRAWRDAGRGYLGYFALAFLAGLTDWFAYFLVPGMWLIDLFESGRAGERLRRAFLIGLPFGISLVVVGAWLVWARGGLENLADHAHRLLLAFDGKQMQQQSDIHRALAGKEPPFFPSLGGHLLRTVGIPVLALAGLGLLRALAGGLRSPLAKVAVAGLVAGALPAFAFRSHAAKHEFWFLMGSVFFALLAAGALFGFERDREAPRRPLGVALLVLLAAVAGYSAWRGVGFHASYRTEAFRDRGRAMARIFGSRDFVMSSLSLAADRFYVDAVMIPGVRTRASYDFLREAFRPHAGSFDRVFILWDPAETADTFWLRDPSPEGRLPYLVRKLPEPIRLGGGDFYLLELDPKGFFAAP
ncbi:MAG: hypothetical protein H6807_13275 [Planctomycetes bacterium]|nr:hypothetical protein [Planctomycetota bacterium]